MLSWVQAKLQVSSAWTVKRVGDKDQKDWATDLIDVSRIRLFYFPVWKESGLKRPALFILQSSDSLRVGIDPSVISGASGGTHSSEALASQ